MKRLVPLLVLASLLTLPGCSGFGGCGDGVEGCGISHYVSASASPNSVPVGGSAVVRIDKGGYGDDATYALRVREGDAGGTLSDATEDAPVNGLAKAYAAPAKPGTYHVVGTVTTASGRTLSDTTAITVTAAQ